MYEILDQNITYTNPWNHSINPWEFANPCGLIAKSFPNGIYLNTR